MSRDCRSASRCSICNGHHHVSICQYTSEPPGPVLPTADGRSLPTASMCTSMRTPVLIQTSRARVSRLSRPDLSIETKLLFDSGNQMSYVTVGPKNKLGLEKKGVHGHLDD